MAIALKFSKSEANIPWGFRLVGGSDFNQPIVVVKVNSNSLAESAGLHVGDIIVRVNETSTAGLTHNEFHNLLLTSGLEFELGIRRGEFPGHIMYNENYDIQDFIDLKKTIEEEVLNEAINEINAMRNRTDNKEKTINTINETMSRQEEIVNSVMLQSATDVKKNKKWSTFLIKPDKPIPNPKQKTEENQTGESYRVVIKKQSRRPSQDKKVQFDQNVTEVEIDIESDEIRDKLSENIQEPEETVDDRADNAEICIDEIDITSDSLTEVVEDEEIPRTVSRERRDSLEIGRERLGSLSPDLKVDISPSLEEQLLEVQRQLQTLSQLPSAIQSTLDAVSKQLATIVRCRESAERNDGDQGEYTDSKEGDEEPQTEEELLEDTTSENAEAEVLREDSDVSITEELADILIQDTVLKDCENEIEDEKEPSPSGLTEEEIEEQRKNTELEAKREKLMEERSPKPIQRPIILPGGRKWSIPEDATPSFRKPKMSDEKIIETIENNLEVIYGKRKGIDIFSESNCWKVPSRTIATKHINFLKYTPPPKKMDYLQRSEVYRLVHDMEPPVRGIISRPEKIPAVQDYYQATDGGP